MSVDIFFGSIPDTEESIHFLAVLESLSREIIVVMLLGTILSKMLYPLNPIYLSKYIALDNDGVLHFRYFTLLKKGNYLYDVHIRVVVSNPRDMNVGEGQLMDEFSQQLEMIRGVRRCVLKRIQTMRILKKLEDSDKKIHFIIKGTDENGVCYTRIKAYEKSDILMGCKFLSIRKSEYAKLDIVKQVDVSNGLIPPVIEGEFIRYQHFNKLYVVSPNYNYGESGDVLSGSKIVYGEFSGIKQILLDMRSMITYLYLERDFKVLKRWFKYWGIILINKIKSLFKKR